MNTILELKDFSFRCKEMFLRKNDGRIVLFTPRQDLKKVYCTQNGVIAFYDEDGNLFAKRWISDAQRILENNGYTRKNFEVPFGEGEQRVIINMY